MAGIMQKINFIKKAVKDMKTDSHTIETLRVLELDSELLPTYKVPVNVLAKASLILLGLEKDLPQDEEIQIWKENLLNA